MSNVIHQYEIEQRAKRDAEAAALAKIQAEREADTQRDAQARAANARQGQAMLAQLAQTWRDVHAPLYPRRADAHRRGDLDDALECERLMKINHDEAEPIIDQASRLLQQQPAVVVAQLRRDAGVPAAHDSLSECPDLSDVRRVIARGMAIGLITPRGLDHPNRTGFLQL